MISAMKHLLPLLFALLLSSCVEYVAFCTHTYADAVGKEVYVPCKQQNRVDVYEHQGATYAQLSYYKTPAQGTLLRGKYFLSTFRLPQEEFPEYKPGDPVYHLYMKIDGQQDAPWLLSEASFAGKKNSGNRCYAIIGSPAGGFTPERSASNYLMMPLTATLFEVDAGLSVVGTAGAYLFYNIPATTVEIIKLLL